MSENIQQDRTDIWMRPTPQQTDTLTTGSERLAAEVITCSDEFESRAEIIKADPGIVALVEGMQEIAAGAPGPIQIAKARLKTWETG